MKQMSPRILEKLFILAQGGFLVLIAGALFYFLRSRTPESSFKVREADLRRKSKPGQDELAQAKIKTQSGPLQLPGIRLDGAPHEILGVSATASAQEIKLAYRELMKRYHPDRIGPPGSREWKDAQRIAERINEAKEFLTRQARKRPG